MIKQICIPKSEYEKFQQAIDSNTPIQDAELDAVIKTYTAKFDNNIEIDIKVCNGNNGPWIDVVLIENSNSIDILDPQYTILGLYSFEHNDVFYCVSVELENEAPT